MQLKMIWSYYTVCVTVKLCMPVTCNNVNVVVQDLLKVRSKRSSGSSIEKYFLGLRWMLFDLLMRIPRLL